MKKNTATKRPQDWHRADIVAALKKNGWSVRALSRAHDLSSGTLQVALERPYPKGEKIIADALGLNVSDIWPERTERRNFTPRILKVING